MEYLPEFLTVVIVHFLAVVSPGPDFILVTKNSIVHSRKIGIYSALGLGIGILVHVAYSLAGIALIISQSIVLFSIMKFIGAGYLIYIGIKSLKAKRTVYVDEGEAHKKDISSWQAFKMGFITNVTNPKATLFFLSLFTVVIKPSTPGFMKALYGAEMCLVTFLWFTLVAVVFSHKIIKNKVGGIQHYAEKFMGAILIALGIKLALISSK